MEGERWRAGRAGSGKQRGRAGNQAAEWVRMFFFFQAFPLFYEFLGNQERKWGTEGDRRREGKVGEGETMERTIKSQRSRRTLFFFFIVSWVSGHGERNWEAEGNRWREGKVGERETEGKAIRPQKEPGTVFLSFILSFKLTRKQNKTGGDRWREGMDWEWRENHRKRSQFTQNNLELPIWGVFPSSQEFQVYRKRKWEAKGTGEAKERLRGGGKTREVQLGHEKTTWNCYFYLNFSSTSWFLRRQRKRKCGRRGTEGRGRSWRDEQTDGSY